MDPSIGRDERVLDRLLETLLALPSAERARRIGNLEEKQPQLAARLARRLARVEQEATVSPPAGAPVREAGGDRGGIHDEAPISRDRSGLRRHAWLATAIVLAAVAAGGFALYRMRESRPERLAEAGRAVQVESFLAETLRAATPYLRDDDRDPLATIATLGGDRLRSARELDPHARARLGMSLAQLHLARGEHAIARQMLDEAASALATRGGDASALRAELLSARAASEADADDTAAAIESQRESIRLLQSAGVPPLQLALAQGQLGDLLRRAGRHDEAGVAFAAAMPPVLADFADAGIDRVRVVDRYVRHLSQSGKLDGLRELRAQLAPRVEREGAHGLADAELGSVLGAIDSLLGEPATAAPALELAAQRFEALLGGAHPRVARSLTDACAARLESGEMARARDLCLRGLAIYRGHPGANGADAALATSHLAVIAYDSGLLPEADRHSERSSEVFDRLGEPDMQVRGHLLRARIAIAQGRHEEALPGLDRAAALHASELADNDAFAVGIAQQRAFALLGLGRSDEAAAALDTAAPAFARIPSPGRNRAWTSVARSQVAGARGDVATLDRMTEAALADYRATSGGNERELGRLFAELALAARAAGREASALALADDALERMTPETSGAHWAHAWATRRLSGGAADADLDARARDLLATQQVDTPTARAFLTLRR